MFSKLIKVVNGIPWDVKDMTTYEHVLPKHLNSGNGGASVDFSWKYLNNFEDGNIFP